MARPITYFFPLPSSEPAFSASAEVSFASSFASSLDSSFAASVVAAAVVSPEPDVYKRQELYHFTDEELQLYIKIQKRMNELIGLDVERSYNYFKADISCINER